MPRANPMSPWWCVCARVYVYVRVCGVCMKESIGSYVFRWKKPQVSKKCLLWEWDSVSARLAVENLVSENKIISEIPALNWVVSSTPPMRGWPPTSFDFSCAPKYLPSQKHIQPLFSSHLPSPSFLSRSQLCGFWPEVFDRESYCWIRIDLESIFQGTLVVWDVQVKRTLVK